MIVVDKKPSWVRKDDNYPFGYCSECGTVGWGVKVFKWRMGGWKWYDRVCENCGYVFYAWSRWSFFG